VPNGTQCVGLDARAAQAACALESVGAEGPRTIVMGLDQHRAQITAEWIDTATGEIGRARVMPGDPAGRAHRPRQRCPWITLRWRARTGSPIRLRG
jgi:hypothetical protein